jgi:hypothetical protein
MNSRVLVMRVYIHCLIAEMVAPNCNRLGLNESGSHLVMLLLQEKAQCML